MDGHVGGGRARWLAAVLVAGLLASVPAVPASAQQGSAPGGFADVAEDAFYADAVAALAADGVFAGTECSEGFCGDQVIDRRTMAVWVVRVLDGADPAAVASTRFGDVDASGFHARFVERMAALGVTAGCGDGSNYRPEGSVSRAHMAVFLARAFDLPAAPDAGFADVPSEAWYGDAVNSLAASGVSAGCGDGTRFCPDSSTTRGQMAVFLARASGQVALPHRPIPYGFIFDGPSPEGYGQHRWWGLRTSGDRVDPYVLGSYRGDMGLSGSESRPIWRSPDGTRIVYNNRTDDRQYFQYFLARADGTGEVKLNNARESFLTPLSWLSDSTRFVFLQRDNDGESGTDLFVADGSGKLKIAEGAEGVVGGSPDGTRLAYISGDGESGYNLFVVAADGGGTTEIAESDSSIGGISWSPDGTRLAYISGDGESGYNLFVVAADGGGATEIVHAGEAALIGSAVWGTYSLGFLRRAVWSPDGTRLAYISGDGESGYNLYVAVVDGGGATKIAESDSGEYIGDISWSPDGARLSFKKGLWDLSMYVASADGSAVVRLHDAVIGHALIDSEWSPDGDLIAYSVGDQMFVARGDGSGRVQIPYSYAGTAEEDCAPRLDLRWSPDGSHVSYLSSLYCQSGDWSDVTAGDGQGFVLADGSGLRRLPDAVAGSWSPDGSRFASLIADGGTVSLVLWDVASGERTTRFEVDMEFEVGRFGEMVWSASGIFGYVFQVCSPCMTFFG